MIHSNQNTQMYRQSRISRPQAWRHAATVISGAILFPNASYRRKRQATRPGRCMAIAMREKLLWSDTPDKMQTTTSSFLCVVFFLVFNYDFLQNILDKNAASRRVLLLLPQHVDGGTTTRILGMARGRGREQQLLHSPCQLHDHPLDSPARSAAAVDKANRPRQ